MSLQNKVTMRDRLFSSLSLNFSTVFFYGRYFPLYSPLELSSPYTCSSSKPPLEYLSHQFSSSVFLNDNLLGNTVQRSTPHKCGHNGRHSAFNVEVATFPQIFWNLPSSQGVCEVFLRGKNFLQYHYIGLSLPPRVSVRYFYVVRTSCSITILVRVSNLNRIQQIRGEISPGIAFLLFPMLEILVDKSQHSLISQFTFLAIQVRG